MEPYSSWDVSSEYLEDIVAGGISNQYKFQHRVTCHDLHLCQNEESSGDPLDAFNSMEGRFFDGSDGHSLASLEIANWDDTSTYPSETITRKLKQEECRFLPSLYPRSSVGFGQEGVSASMDYMEKKIAYPFDMVKRGKTVDGHVTLEDINSRILMPPARPIKHPVGEFAPSPPCASSRSFGITGKAVVALAKVHTQGRGTITVIRTKS